MTCAMRSALEPDKSHSESTSIYGGSFLCTAYVALLDEDRLFISSLAQVSPTLAEKRRNVAMPANILFRPGRPGLAFPGRESILKLREQLAQFRLEEAARITKSREEELFKFWSSILKAKTFIEKSKENPIRYNGFSVNGNRIVFSIGGHSGGDLAGQARLVKDNEFVKVTGEVERATGAEIVLYVTNWYSHDLPLEGTLSIDVEAARLAIDRQRAVRIGRSENSRISKAVESLLLDSQMDAWREEVLQKGRVFLEELASRQGISHKEVQIGIEFEKLSVTQEDLNELKTREMAIESRIGELTPKVPPVKSGATIKAPSQDEIQSRRDLEEERDKVKAEMRSRAAQCEAIRATLKNLDPDTSQLVSLPSNELHTWAETFLPKNEVNEKLRRMFEIHAEWQARFGRTSDFQAALLRAAQVVAGTCVGMASIKGVSELDFDVCIVDEASKAAPTELLVPLSRCRRWIVVGDQRQLPPFIDEGFRDPETLERFGLNEHSIKATLFDRLQELLPAECKTVLSTQYRMVPAIGNLISECFYSSTLKSAPKEWDRTFEGVLPKPVVWLSTSRDLKRHESPVGRSYQNDLEIRVIHSLLKRLNSVASSTGRRWKVAVLTGYAPQIAMLEKRFGRDVGDCRHLDIEWNTVDAVQGRQADVTIYSVTRSNPQGKIGFLRDASRLNVALSRSRHYLVLVGDHEFFRDARGENPFKKVIDYIDRHPQNCKFQEGRV